MPAAPLFVTRKFAPSVGGMETLSGTVWQVLRQEAPGSSLIAYGGGNDIRLGLWFLGAFARVAVRLVRGKVSVVLVGDALTGAVLSPLLLLSRARHATMVMGLDLTYPNALYRKLVLPLLRRHQRILAISAATADTARAAGIPPERVSVIRLGVTSPGPSALAREEKRQRVLARWGLEGRPRLTLTLGRLVRRKGARWYVAEVLPKLPADVHHLLAGVGPEEDLIREAAREAGVSDRVHLLGLVTEEEREDLLGGVDLFVQPNVAVPGDMEGFGLVTIEAALRGLPVVAADLEGIKDAVVSGVTGILLPSGAAQEWTDTLAELLADPAALAERGEAFRERALDLYSEEAMAQSLFAALQLAPPAPAT